MDQTQVLQLTPYCCVLRREVALGNTNFILSGLTGQGLNSQSTVLHGQHANNYTTDAVT